MNKEYTFLQISDLHFGKETRKGRYDPDTDLRNEMLQDMLAMRKKYDFLIEGILICGDIAFSGRKSDYECAENFIDKIREQMKVDITKVYCVPGNHDVNQMVPKNSLSVFGLQKLLENADLQSLANYLGQMANGTEESKCDAELLYKPIEAYNCFADRHSARLNIDNPYIDDALELDEGYQLVIHSMNSTLVSNAEDHNWKNKSEKKMVIDTSQIPLSAPKCIYMTLCHHPVEFWRDKNKMLETRLNKRVKIQLFGHTHEQNIYKGDGYVRIISGALQPNRGEDRWVSEYNFISVRVEDGELFVRIFPRIMDDYQTQYISAVEECDEGKEYKDIKISMSEEDVLDEYRNHSVVQKEDTSADECRKTEWNALLSDSYQEKRKFIIYFNNLTNKDKEELFLEFPFLLHVEGKKNLTQKELFLMAEDAGNKQLLAQVNEWMKNKF